MESFLNLSNLLSIFIGGLITWLVSYIYYRRASMDLFNEASELRKLNDLILRGLEEADLVKLNRDDSGSIVGLVIHLSASVRGSSNVSGNLTVPRK